MVFARSAPFRSNSIIFGVFATIYDSSHTGLGSCFLQMWKSVQEEMTNRNQLLDDILLAFKTEFFPKL